MTEQKKKSQLFGVEEVSKPKEKEEKPKFEFVNLVKVGDMVEGDIQSIYTEIPFKMKDGTSGKGTFVVIQDITRGEICLWLSKVLQTWFDKAELKVKDYIGIKFVGWVEGKDHKYKNFDCRKA